MFRKGLVEKLIILAVKPNNNGVGMRVLLVLFKQNKIILGKVPSMKTANNLKFKMVSRVRFTITISNGKLKVHSNA